MGAVSSATMRTPRGLSVVCGRRTGSAYAIDAARVPIWRTAVGGCAITEGSAGSRSTDLRSGNKKELVPWARLELAQLAPLPPQDSVSTNFTTKALVRRDGIEPSTPCVDGQRSND